jgi:hypothetical protein
MPSTPSRRGTNHRRPRELRRPSPELLATAVCGAILFLSSAHAGDIGRARLDRDTLTVGDPITVTLEFEAPARFRLGPLTWPYPPDTLVQVDSVRFSIRDDSVWTVETRLVLFTPGRLVAVPEALMLYDPTGDSSHVLFPPESVTVASVLPVDQDSIAPAGYKALIEPPGRIPLWLWALALAVVALFALVIWYARRPRSVAIKRAAPARPPWEVALASLAALEAREYHTRGESRLFALELSEIARRYLEDRFGFVALEQTTAEIRTALRFLDVTDAQRDSMLAALQGCDLVKYARFHWPAPELVVALARVRGFITETTPRTTEEVAAV